MITTETPVSWRKYDPSLRSEWDNFVLTQSSGCFLFQRAYMEYHSDRFVDGSLLGLRGNQIEIAIPANYGPEGELISHQGLTFGGPVFRDDLTLKQKVDLLSSLKDYARTQDLRRIVFRPIPAEMRGRGSHDTDFALTLLGANLFRRDLNAIVTPGEEVEIQERRARGAKKALKNGVVVTFSDCLDEFWRDVLTPVLTARHGVRPTHTLEEIRKLADSCKGIRLCEARKDGRMIAGTLLFDYPSCVHSQYIAGTEEGRSIGALDLIFCELVPKALEQRKSFSFGISTENAGHDVNYGLLEWKQGFGARTMTHDHYAIDLV